MTLSDRYLQARKITLIGALANALLGAIKLIGGLVYHSHGLVADGVHSFSDLITDFMVLFASKYGSQDADDSHPYGHQRIETAATFILALLLILAGLGIIWDAVDEIIRMAHDRPSWFALPIALLSIVINELLFFYTRSIGNRIQSPLVIANAWHHRSDAASSIVVSLGILGSLLSFTYFDALAAVIVGLLIVRMGVNYGWDSVKELVDTAVEPSSLQKIEKIILEIDGIEKIHQLRSRLMGGDIFIDVHILINPQISVSEGHYIAQRVHYALMQQLPRIKDVTVHVDPEDDELSCPCYHLPSRKSLQEKLLFNWQKDYPTLQNWTLHYLDGKITIDLLCSDNQSNPALLARIKQDLQNQTEIHEVRLFSQHGIIH